MSNTNTRKPESHLRSGLARNRFTQLSKAAQINAHAEVLLAPTEDGEFVVPIGIRSLHSACKSASPYFVARHRRTMECVHRVLYVLGYQAKSLRSIAMTPSAPYLDEINQIAQVVGVYDAFAVLQPYDLAMRMAVDLRIHASWCDYLAFYECI
jgi:hypothetical protein